MPLLIAALAGFAAAATLARNGLTTVRRRRRELAILTTLGFTRAQVRGAVAWQATIVVAIGTLVGVPLGAGAGRWVWDAFAAHTGFASEPITPTGATMLVLPAAVLVANLIALLPGALAARRGPAAILRAE
jgi:putative ABC transport system permease protein